MEIRKTVIPEVALGLPIVIWAPNFDENSGGCIVLHALAYQLRQLGIEAYISKDLPKAPETASRERRFGLLWAMNELRQANRNRLARRRGGPPAQNIRLPHHVHAHAAMPVPSAPYLGERSFIAVYPEIIRGNPFGAPHVARWLLFDPGASAGDGRFGQDELTFFYQPAFAANFAGADPDNLLQTRWLRDDIYSNHGSDSRSAQCRMIRKGDAAGVPDDDTAILLDGKSHAEIASIFNRCDRFYCHDPYTMYLYYAALCGCTPIVVPQANLTGETWRASFEMKHGVAWGEDEVEWAIATRDQLFVDMARARQAEVENVRGFVHKLKVRFGC